MKIQLNEKSLSTVIAKDPLHSKKPKAARPNIEHLIKRIRIEKRAESKKDIIIFGFVLFLIGGIILFSFYN